MRGKVPCAPVFDVRQALENPFVAEQGGLLDFEHPERGPIRGVASPIRPGDSDHPRRAAPVLGEYTDDLLLSLGYSVDDVRALRADSAIL